MVYGNGLGGFSSFVFSSLNPLFKSFVGPQKIILCCPMAVVSVYKKCRFLT